MRVRLLKNVIEGNGVKVVRRRRQPDGTYAIEHAFVKDAEIEMSDASGQKYIDAGLAELVVTQEAAADQPSTSEAAS